MRYGPTITNPFRNNSYMAKQVRKDPTTGAATWSSQFQAAGPKYQAGVQAVTEAPNAAAAKAADKWQARVSDPKTKAKFVAMNNKVSLSDWQQAAVTFGVPNLARGAAKGQSKYESFAQKFYPFLSGNMAKVAAMPSTTLQDNIARATTMMTLNAGFTNS